VISSREVIPQPGERWLLRHDGRCYAIPAALGRRLREGEDAPGLEEALAADQGRPGPAGGRTLWLKLPLVPTRLVERAARALTALVSWRGLALSASIGGVGYLAAALTGMPPGRDFDWPGLVLCLVSAGLVHELGHAAALVRGGGRPGGVGIGMLFVFPALYCDVTAVALLPRRERVRVDAAGVAWHLAAGGGLALGGVVLGVPTLSVASWGVLAAVVWSLLPFLRTDGYWLLCDLLGARVLEELAPVGATWRLRAILIAWRVGYLLFLGFMTSVLIGRLKWLVSLSATWRSVERVCIILVVAFIGVVVSIHMVRRGVLLGRGVWRDARGRVQ